MLEGLALEPQLSVVARCWWLRGRQLESQLLLDSLSCSRVCRWSSSYQCSRCAGGQVKSGGGHSCVSCPKTGLKAREYLLESLETKWGRFWGKCKAPYPSHPQPGQGGWSGLEASGGVEFVEAI